LWRSVLDRLARVSRGPRLERRTPVTLRRRTSTPIRCRVVSTS
jgi:hypothetical protein